MIYDLQKASMWKRISAFLFDFILLVIAVAGFAFILSAAFGFDKHNTALNDAYAKYEAEYGVVFDISQEEFLSFAKMGVRALLTVKLPNNAFAKQVGLASSTISDWKTKKTNPSVDKIMDICMVLDVTPEQLLTGKGIDDVEYKPKKVKAEFEISKADIEIIRDINTLKKHVLSR